MNLKLPKDLFESLKRRLKKEEKALEEEKVELEEQDTYDIPGRDVGNAEIEDEAEEDRVHLELESKKTVVDELHSQVEKAQAKMKRGDYGTCDTCGEDISKDRLEAYPEATTCMKCAELKNNN